MMSLKTIIQFMVCGSLMGFILFYFYGGAIWHPVYLKITGKKTLSDVYDLVGRDAEKQLKEYFKKANTKYPPEAMTIIALKNERQLEVWAIGETENRLIHTYRFTGFSGKIGPKLKSGDKQIPEGLYNVEYMNPNSRFYLSFKINYPNHFDMEMAKRDSRSNLGGDIFIHGKSATIGCIPIGNVNIEELFTLVYRTGMKNVNVIIAPYDMRKY